MPIETDAQLRAAARKAGDLLQEIQDYALRNQQETARVRFPRGYIRSASQQRARLSFLDDANLQSNIAYTMILSDVQHWLLTRTDIAATAKEMLIKLQLFFLGSIVESITKVQLKGKCGGSYCKRTEHLCGSGVISSKLKVELDWIWDMRNNMHLFLLDNSEYTSTDYTTANHNRAVRAFQSLLEALS